jgi:hypothetical protein
MGFEQQIASELTVAEVLATLERENVPLDFAARFLRRLVRIHPPGDTQPLRREALAVGRAKGADLWHLVTACALCVPQQRKALHFASLDSAQRYLAAGLGFPIIPA